MEKFHWRGKRGEFYELTPCQALRMGCWRKGRGIKPLMLPATGATKQPGAERPSDRDTGCDGVKSS